MTTLVHEICYNDIPPLDEARSVDDVINGPICDVFLKHSDHLTLCLYLQHRHHTVGTDHAVVKVKGTAHLMDGQVVKEIVSFGNKIVPTTWMVFGGKVLPMEFALIPATGAITEPTPAFFLEFLSVLDSNGCNGLFGIDTISKSDWTEIKIGDASVVVPNNDDSDSHDQSKFIPVAFAFDEKPNFRVHGRCKTEHKHSSRPKPKPKPKPK